jgi:hypothetical protein
MNSRPNLSPHKAALREARQERLAQALRDNLRRRKEQLRRRENAAEIPGAPVPRLSGEASSAKSGGCDDTPPD